MLLMEAKCIIVFCKETFVELCLVRIFRFMQAQIIITVMLSSPMPSSVTFNLSPLPFFALLLVCFTLPPQLLPS